MNKHDVMEAIHALDRMEKAIEKPLTTRSEVEELKKGLLKCYHGNAITTTSANVAEFYRLHKFNVQPNGDKWKITCPYRFGTDLTLFAVVGTTDEGIKIIAGWKYNEKTDRYEIILSNSFRMGMEMTFDKDCAKSLLNSIKNNKEFPIYYDDSDSKKVDFSTFKIKEMGFID